MIFDGKTFAKERLEALIKKRSAFRKLSLGVVMGEHDPVTSSFVRVKERNAKALEVSLSRYFVSDGATTDMVIKLVHEAAEKENGIIVQLPLGKDIDADAVLATIPSEKDVDGLSKAPLVSPPVVAAIHEIFERYDISYQGKKVVIVGKGRLVGAPAAQYFEKGHAEVTVLERGDAISAYTAHADILVLGAGTPGIVTADMVKEGVVVLDAGTSEQAGVVVGDADPKVAEKASFFTPVPGGIGPVAVVEIFGNLFILNR